MKYGLINLHKPVGPTSRYCVNRVLQLLGDQKVAHAGTLDPLASGVLVLLIGPAVRLMDDVHAYDKEYVGRFRLGLSSPSGDKETESIEVPVPPHVDRSAILGAIASFVGDIEQTPPAYSAIRVGGRRAHEVARSGKKVDVPSRRVTVHSMDLVDCELPEFELRIACSTGTYIRTLGCDIARSLGTEAIMTDLIRTRVGPFRLEDSVDLETLESQSIDPFLLSAIQGILHLPHWTLSDDVLRNVLDGKKLEPSELGLGDACDTPSVPALLGQSGLSDLSDLSDLSGLSGQSGQLVRVGIRDSRGILRAIMKQLADGRWHCEKGIAHWDVYP